MAHAYTEKVEPAVFRALMGLPTPVMRALAGRRVVVDGQVLDTETQWMLRIQRMIREPAAETLPFPEARAALRRQSRLVGGRQPIGLVRDLKVPGAEEEIPARLYVPRGQVATPAPSPLLFFVHGGGMMYGDLDSHDAVCRFLAEQADVRVISVDYRLAPEHRFPAAVDDCWASYQWVVENAGELGADPERIAVGGDSAGGYLSAVTAILAAEAGVPVKHQLLVYPVTNMADKSDSRHTFGEGFYLTTEFMDLAEVSYLHPEQDRRDPKVSVYFTEKVPENLAPAFVVTAGFDPLRDEGEAFARKLQAAGVPVTLRRHAGLIHGFVNMLSLASVARSAMHEAAVALGHGLRAR